MSIVETTEDLVELLRTNPSAVVSAVRCGDSWTVWGVEA